MYKIVLVKTGLTNAGGVREPPSDSPDDAAPIRLSKVL
jgi:hypothetical protein